MQTQALGGTGFSSFGTGPQLPWGMWRPLGPGSKPMSSALAGRLLTTRPPRKSQNSLLKHSPTVEQLGCCFVIYYDKYYLPEHIFQVKKIFLYILNYFLKLASYFAAFWDRWQNCFPKGVSVFIFNPTRHKRICLSIHRPVLCNSSKNGILRFEKILFELVRIIVFQIYIFWLVIGLKTFFG